MNHRRTNTSGAPSGLSALLTPSSLCPGDQQHCDEAKAVEIPYMDIEVLKKAYKEQEVGPKADQEVCCL